MGVLPITAQHCTTSTAQRAVYEPDFYSAEDESGRKGGISDEDVKGHVCVVLIDTKHSFE